MPRRPESITTPVSTKGVTPMSPMGFKLEAAPLLAVEVEVEVELEPLVATVAEPEPGVAVEELPPPAFWLPSPVRPGPVPAPDFMYLLAPDGIAGSSSPVNEVRSKVSELAGQVAAVSSVLYPPSPVGAGYAAYWVFKAAKSELVATEVPLIVTRP